jgi:excisionase family DNA binding protein
MNNHQPLTTADERLLTLDEVAAALQIPKGTVYKWSAAGGRRFPRCLRLGKHIRVRQADLDAWIEEQLR